MNRPRVIVRFEELDWQWNSVLELLDWIAREYPGEDVFYLLKEDDDLPFEEAVLEVWVGDIPPGREHEV